MPLASYIDYCLLCCVFSQGILLKWFVVCVVKFMKQYKAKFLFILMTTITNPPRPLPRPLIEYCFITSAGGGTHTATISSSPLSAAPSIISSSIWWAAATVLWPWSSTIPSSFSSSTVHARFQTPTSSDVWPYASKLPWWRLPWKVSGRTCSVWAF